MSLLHCIAKVYAYLYSLLLWREPDATMKLYKFLCAFFIISLFVSNSYMFTVIGEYNLPISISIINTSYVGLGIGFKLFIMDHIYRKYPKVCILYTTIL